MSITNDFYMNFKKKIMELLSNKDYILSKLKEKNAYLKQKKNEYYQNLIKIETIILENRTCLHCQEKYIPKFNDDTSCNYHYQSLLYYSCRSCGADEYYPCCMKCYKCLTGCKNGKHLSIVN